MTFVLQHTVSTSPNWFVQTWWSLLPDLHFKTQQGFPEKNAKLDYLKQLSHFLQLAMGGVRKKKNEVEEKSEVADYTQFKVPNPSGVLGKVLFRGGGGRWGRGGGKSASAGETAPRSDCWDRPWSPHPHAGRATGTVLEAASMRTLRDRMFGDWTFRTKSTEK